MLTLGTPCADEAREHNLPVFECGSDDSNDRCSFDVYTGDNNILTRKAEWLSSRALRVSLGIKMKKCAVLSLAASTSDPKYRDEVERWMILRL